MENKSNTSTTADYKFIVSTEPLKHLSIRINKFDYDIVKNSKDYLEQIIKKSVNFNDTLLVGVALSDPKAREKIETERPFIKFILEELEKSKQLRFWDFLMQINTPKGSVNISTVQWFNQDGEYSGNTIKDVEDYLEKMWIANGSLYYMIEIPVRKDGAIILTHDKNKNVEVLFKGEK